MSYREINFPDAVNEFTSHSRWHEDLTLKWNEYVRTGFPKYLTVHREGAGSKADGFVFVGSLGPFCAQAVDEMVGRGMEDVSEHRLCQEKNLPSKSVPTREAGGKSFVDRAESDNQGDGEMGANE